MVSTQEIVIRAGTSQKKWSDPFSPQKRKLKQKNENERSNSSADLRKTSKARDRAPGSAPPTPPGLRSRRSDAALGGPEGGPRAGWSRRPDADAQRDRTAVAAPADYLGLQEANLWLQDDKLRLRRLCGFLDAADRHKAGSARPVAALWAPRCLRLRHEVAPRAPEAAGTRGAPGGPAGQDPGAHGALLLPLPLDQEERGRGRRHRLPQIEGLPGRLERAVGGRRGLRQQAERRSGGGPGRYPRFPALLLPPQAARGPPEDKAVTPHTSLDDPPLKRALWPAR
uniref:Uncharacterized protein n=1 Tax=Rangifer tarandus platyrhynchus TaxID=3082113 RepID=A0ACB0E1P2_RANTA|nr:unnamed protein product [Rangifer tarandus platyrhynchus]